MTEEKTQTFEKIDIVQILEKLPHRYPFILVDRVVEVDTRENKIVGIKNVTINEPFFQGHFPNMPIMPGVLIVEALAQTGGILMYQKGYRGIKVLASLKEVKFRKVVVPGDVIYLECQALHLSSRGGKIKGTARVDNKIAAEGEIVFGVLPKA